MTPVFDKLVDLVVQFVELGRFWIVLDQYEQGVLLRLGRFVKVVEPGFHWMWPLRIDHVLSDSVVMRTQSLGTISTTSLDGKQVGFEVIVTHKINDIETALLKVNQVEDAIRDACAGTVGQFLSSISWQDMNTQETADRLSTVCRKKGWKYGIEVMSVQLAGVSLVRNIRLMNSGHITH